MFSTETLGKCTVMKIHDLLPKKVRNDINSSQKDGFLFMAQSESKLLVYQNIGYDPTETEVNQLKKHISNWGGGEMVDVQNRILEMQLPSFLIPFYNDLNNLPGCRVFPNLLRVGGDVYICIEYDQKVSNQVSQIVMEFISEDHLFKKELVYSGPQDGGPPYLLKLYGDFGNNINDFVVIKTVWEFTREEVEKQNQGVFLNTGSYVPKCFIHQSTDKLIFRKNVDEIKGNAPSTTIDGANGVVEFNVRSQFYSDFYNEVIRLYSGPIFLHMEVFGDKQETYFIIEKNQQAIFIKGLKNHWKRTAREDHVNYIDYVETLGNVMSKA